MTIVDTNILYYKYSGKFYETNFNDHVITSINALEFLKNIEKVHHNKAKYHIPRIKSFGNIHQIMHLAKSVKDHKNFILKNFSDHIIFDFKQDFESYALYNNESIAEVINNKIDPLFYSSIDQLKKKDYKEIKSKYDFIIKNNFQCVSITEEDIILSYSLLESFLQNHTLKSDFRNSWNDMLILGKAINTGSLLLTSDKLLNRFASEHFQGNIKESESHVEIKFPKPTIESKKVGNKLESKGYINRGWDFKIRKG